MKKIVLIRNFVQNFGAAAENFTLSPERRARAAQLCSAQEKQSFQTAEFLTHALLCKAFSCPQEIGGRAGEKPYLKGMPSVSFSRSYCADALCLAAEDADGIGIDAEMLLPAQASVLRFCLTAQEQAYVQSSADAAFAFTLLWTRKESYLKSLGAGLQFRFDQTDCTPTQPAQNSGWLFSHNDKIGTRYINSYRAGNLLFSVCSKKDEPFPACTEIG